jgi:hypothetical protein
MGKKEKMSAATQNGERGLKRRTCDLSSQRKKEVEPEGTETNQGPEGLPLMGTNGALF